MNVMLLDYDDRGFLRKDADVWSRFYDRLKLKLIWLKQLAADKSLMNLYFYQSVSVN